ncbi:MAG TPA: pyridoxamine 5'-phosphate oxidase [Solirubrobacteraceae bacterium]
MDDPGEHGLEERDLAPSWLEQFEAWWRDVEAAGVPEPQAMVLGTVGADGQPSARSVLLKGVDERGFEFFTNLQSRKGGELAANPRASLVFPWYALRRQVTVAGTVTAVEQQRADEYFASRAYGSKLGALVSRQSSVISSREPLERERAELERRYPPGADVPRPAHWGGFRLVPSEVEFWQGRRDRLHDRLRYRRSGERWVLERLSP